jgi:hypothetical protein
LADVKQPQADILPETKSEMALLSGFPFVNDRRSSIEMPTNPSNPVQELSKPDIWNEHLIKLQKANGELQKATAELQKMSVNLQNLAFAPAAHDGDTHCQCCNVCRARKVG